MLWEGENVGEIFTLEFGPREFHRMASSIERRK
jgi:hypothetical protein